ncbi:MAG: SMC-Scp complex subunit ScpB [Candidatus Nitrohelix vancouverensis]|uniref:Segregation and condensation protein B n=1 Tax=Candidatus Nitrohelix vancouverensis TaxID=2705534 RepID=A0A7T0G357_9BACT|nr:MAG: SMC-Scp complex subunit ScpB [Candidatus Nitrohelix vancouverensis]
MEREEIKAIIENLLLAADNPLTPEHLKQTFTEGPDLPALKDMLEELKEEYSARNLQIIEVAEGYQLTTRNEYVDWVRKFLKLDKTAKLSQPSLDTLSIIAYKQPLTRQEVDDVRGVDSSGVIKTLLDKKIISPAGRKQVAGRPIMYKTTRKFLEYFGLKDLSDMPTLEDFKEVELDGDDDETQQSLFDFGTMPEGAETPETSEGADTPDESAAQESPDAAALPDQTPEIDAVETDTVETDATDDLETPVQSGESGSDAS